MQKNRRSPRGPDEKHCSDKRVVSSRLIHCLEEVCVEVRQAAMVLVVLRGVRRLGVAVLEHDLEERDWELGLREHCCAKCNGPMRRLKNKRKVTRMTLLGRITYRRSRYVCQHCGQRVFLLDELPTAGNALVGPRSQRHAQAALCLGLTTV